MRRRFMLFVLLLFACLMLAVSTVRAQNALTYGTGATGQISAESPFAFYTFEGGEGDIITARVIGLDPAFRPSISLDSADGQQVVFSNSDPYSPTVGSARFDYRLSQAGTYTIQVGGVDGAGGQFALRLDGISTDSTLDLQGPVSTPSAIPFNATAPAQVLALQANTAEALQFRVQGGDVNYAVSFHDTDGTLLGVLTPDAMGAASRELPAGDATYFARVRNLDSSDVSINVGLYRGAVNDPAAGGQTSAEPQGTPFISEDDCVITTSGAEGVNVRQGPGINFEVITILPPGRDYVVVGRNGDWFTIDFNGVFAWMSASVTTLSGPCDNILFLEPSQLIPTIPAPTESAP